MDLTVFSIILLLDTDQLSPEQLTTRLDASGFFKSRTADGSAQLWSPFRPMLVWQT